MKPKPAETLGDVLQQYLRAIGAEKRIKEMRIMQNWEKLVGRYVCRDVQNMDLKDGILTVKFRTGIIRNEISMRKTTIKDLLNQEAGEEAIKEIVIK